VCVNRSDVNEVTEEDFTTSSYTDASVSLDALHMVCHYTHQQLTGNVEIGCV